MKQVESDFDLPRLNEAGDSALSRAVRGLREHRPDVTELASLASQLAVRGIPLKLPEAPPNVARAAWKKWLLAGGGAASGLLLWWGLRDAPPATEALPAESPREVAPRAVADPQPSPSARRRGGAVSVVERPAADTPAVIDEVEPTDSEPIGSEQAPSAPGPTPATEHPTSPRVTPASRTPSTVMTNRPVMPEVSSAASVPTEIELLRDARLSLKSSPAHALELAESHARSYPSGKLTQERELIAISALVSLGRRTAALSRASRFERAFPQSPYRKQIGDLLQ
ncbi:MAG: hypothetical protein K0R38_6848 [Polyangiaceae bacterium]|nr:hypothetical protein [Polyangiaceae bacterium]